MAIVLQSFTTGATGGVPQGSISCTVPSGVNVGDLLLLQNTEYALGFSSIPTGWIQLGTIFYYRIATAADTSAPIYTFTYQSNDTGGVVMSRISGADTNNPINAYSEARVPQGFTATSIDAGTITPSVANTVLVLGGSYAFAGTPTPTYATSNTTPTYTAQYSFNSVSGKYASAATAPYSPTTATGTNTFGVGGASLNMGAGIVAIQPPQPISVSPIILTAIILPLIAVGSNILAQPAFSTFVEPAPTTTNSDSKWTRQQESATSWSTGSKSATTWTDSSKTFAYNYLLAEDSTHLLQESGFKIILEQSGTPTAWTDQTKT